MTSVNPEQMQWLGILPDLDYSTGKPVYTDREVFRDYDHMIIPSARLDRYGRNCLRQLLDKADNEAADYRLRTADLSCVDLEDAGNSLASFGFDVDHPMSVDWVAVGKRLDAMARYGGDAELRKLYALLMSDEAPEAVNGDA